MDPYVCARQIDSLHSALYRSAVSSNVLSIFIQTHATDFNHRLHALLAHSSSNHTRLQDNLAAERNLREQAEKLLSEREAFFSRKLGAFKDGNHRSEGFERYRDAVVEMENMKKGFDKENEQLLSQVKCFRNVVDEALIKKENVGKLFEDERKKVDKLELAVAGTKEVVVKTEAELRKGILVFGPFNEAKKGEKGCIFSLSAKLPILLLYPFFPPIPPPL
ncbi:hypothetical protein Fmac_027469 [Flemingia macrophylla]|uniref:Uncharacterized protein n=1 Tax=Flemingia macrophylla TaxID=520843 RepID=A0ABD1LJF7_9FABA